MSLVDRLCLRVADHGLPPVYLQRERGGWQASSGKYSGWGVTQGRAVFNLLAFFEDE